MEVNNYFGIIKKFNERPSIIFLREFKANFSIVVCELEFKYGVNYIEVFAFKQSACYVHYEALDVYEEYCKRILSVTYIPNPVYAKTIAIASQATLQVTIAHNGCRNLSLGIGTRFEALLQSRMVVQRYFYIDVDPIAKQVVASRMMELIAKFPQ